MNFKKNESQSVGTLPLLRIGNKISIEGVPETKFAADMKGWTIFLTAKPGDPSHNQPPNADTIAYACKILLKGP